MKNRPYAVTGYVVLPEGANVDNLWTEFRRAYPGNSYRRRSRNIRFDNVCVEIRIFVALKPNPDYKSPAQLRAARAQLNLLEKSDAGS